MLTRHAVQRLPSSALITLAACQEAVPATDAQVVQEQKIDAPLLAQLGASGVLPVAILLKSQFLLGPDGLEDFASQNGSRARSELRTEVVRTLQQAASTEQTARDLAPDGKDDRTGAGLIDAVAAVREALAR